MILKSESRNIVGVETLKVQGGVVEHANDYLSVEEPLEICVAGTCDGAEFSRTIAVTMRTPGHDEELALGFLFNEGIIGGLSDVQNVWTRDCNFVCVTLRDGLRLKEEVFERHSFIASSCGVCGKKSVESVLQHRAFSIAACELTISAQIVSSLPERLTSRQEDFVATGGIHACALFDPAGNIIDVREDVGRHNALDKLIGSRLKMEALPLSQSVLLLSGRASFELIQKSVNAGIPIVASVGAPSSLAVELAQESGITLCGFVRGERFNIYTGAQRIGTLAVYDRVSD